jgi:predicted Kef-type K+ transport protein
MFSGNSLTPACGVTPLMYVIIHAYVTTMAATAMTISKSVASIGDIAFLVLNSFIVKRFTFYV